MSTVLYHSQEAVFQNKESQGEIPEGAGVKKRLLDKLVPYRGRLQWRKTKQRNG